MRITIQSPVFDYRALRLLMGLIAVFLPSIVCLFSNSSLSSISAAYYTQARDVFVGLLFVVGALLWAYNGHHVKEAIASKVAALMAVFVAIFPTASSQSTVSIISSIHYISAAILFAILAWFCFVPFRKNTKGQGGKKGIRSRIYFVCGCVMAACILSLLITKLLIAGDVLAKSGFVFWAETIALLAFGIAWFVAGKWLGFLVDPEDKLKLFR